MSGVVPRGRVGTEHGMIEDEFDPYLSGDGIDLSLDPDEMLSVRERVRQYLVKKVHAHRIAARVNRNAGNVGTARNHELEAEKTILMIAALDEAEPPDGLISRPS